MPRGQPDYGAYAVKEVTAALADMGELAVRLGSIVTYDRRGEVVAFDDFEDPILKWVISTSPAASYVILDSTHVKSGSQSVKLYHPNVINSYAIIEKYFAILVSKRLGIEISWHSRLQGGELNFYFAIYDGTNEFAAELLFNEPDGKLYIYDSDGNWVEVATAIFPLLSNHEFRTMKLVVDFKTEKYVRLLIDIDEYDISATSLRKVASGNRPNITIGLSYTAKTVVTEALWATDFIFTQAEP